MSIGKIDIKQAIAAEAAPCSHVAAKISSAQSERTTVPLAVIAPSNVRPLPDCAVNGRSTCQEQANWSIAAAVLKQVRPLQLGRLWEVLAALQNDLAVGDNALKRLTTKQRLDCQRQTVTAQQNQIKYERLSTCYVKGGAALATLAVVPLSIVGPPVLQGFTLNNSGQIINSGFQAWDMSHWGYNYAAQEAGICKGSTDTVMAAARVSEESLEAVLEENRRRCVNLIDLFRDVSSKRDQLSQQLSQNSA